MSNEYWDKHPAERTTDDLPPLMGQNDNPAIRMEAAANSPAIDGVPCSVQEKGFHNDALAVMAGEESVQEPTPEEIEAWRTAAIARGEERKRRIRCDLAVEQLLTGMHVAVGNTESALAALTKDDLTPAMQDKLYTLFYWAGRTMERAASLVGAEYAAPMSLAALVDEKRRSELRANLQKSVEQARGENPSA